MACGRVAWKAATLVALGKAVRRKADWKGCCLESWAALSEVMLLLVGAKARLAGAAAKACLKMDGRSADAIVATVVVVSLVTADVNSDCKWYA